MTTWTPAAEAFFRSYLAACFNARPADELAQDLRVHVHEELTQRGVSEVTQSELKEVFEELGYPEDTSEWTEVRSTTKVSSPYPSEGVRNTGFIFYYVVPLVVVLLEKRPNAWCSHVKIIVSSPKLDRLCLWYSESMWLRLMRTSIMVSRSFVMRYHVGCRPGSLLLKSAAIFYRHACHTGNDDPRRLKSSRA